MDSLTATLALLRPDELAASWRYIDLLERANDIDPEEADRWKRGFVALAEFYSLGPIASGVEHDRVR